MRKALLIGINHYELSPLKGCVNDAKHMSELLARHEDGTPNFQCKILTSDRYDTTLGALRKQLDQLFVGTSEVTLLYFSGHGALTNYGGFLAAADSSHYREGIAMSEVLELAARAIAEKRHPEVVILLDCCYSGRIGQMPGGSNGAVLPEGISILSASQANQESLERQGGGVFTSILCDALSGGAADVLGRITAAGLYNYADQLLGPWEQRPLFKSHVSRMISLRDCRPKIPLRVLRSTVDYFPAVDHAFPLDPSYEPEADPPDEAKHATFNDLQRMASASLVEPVDATHMYFAAMQSKSCKLTARGRFYWRLAKEGRV